MAACMSLKVLIGIQCLALASGKLTHGFDTVGSSMFGWFGMPAANESFEFYANNYGLVIMGGDSRCNVSDTDDYGLFEAARIMKKMNPKITLLLYEATQFGMLCLGSEEMKLHPEWWLKDDNGKVYNRTYIRDGKELSLGPQSIDWRIPAARDWWIKSVTQAHDGVSLFDGLLVDSAGPDVHLDNLTHFMSYANMKALIQAKMDMLGDAKNFFSQTNGGEVLGNPTLDWGVVGSPSRQGPFPETYHWQYLTGTLDEMFGAFGSQNQNGTWNAAIMNISINAIIDSTTRLNATVVVRGYPGPCNVPFNQVNLSCVGQQNCPTSGPKAGITSTAVPTWPTDYPEKQPVTVKDYQDASVRLLDQALAPYMILAGPSVWWSYAYFYDTVTGWYPSKEDPDSTLAPPEWYPEFSRPWGMPAGPAVSNGRYQWTRKFEHAEAFIDLTDRTKSKVTWF